MGNTSVDEVTTSDGRLSMSHNHVALLMGLAARPGGYADSKKEWIDSALKVARDLGLETSTNNLRHAIDTLNESWVHSVKVSTRVQNSLSQLGRRRAFEIAHGQLDVYVSTKKTRLWKLVSKSKLAVWGRVIGQALTRPAPRH